MSRTHSPSAVDFFDEVVTGYLDGTTAVNARPITFAEIEALDSGGGPSDLLGYVAVDSDPERPGQPLLAPAHLAVTRRPGPPGDVHAMKDPDPISGVRRPDRGAVAGRRVHIEVTTAFRRVDTYTLFTTADAETATAAGDFLPAAHGRAHLYLADDRADEVSLAPINGAYATVSFAAPGVSPKALADRLRQVLADEFGVDDKRVVKVQTSATLDHRVDVTDRDGNLVAVNVLEAEVGNLMSIVPNGPLSTRRSAGGDVVVGG